MLRGGNFCGLYSCCNSVYSLLKSTSHTENGNSSLLCKENTGENDQNRQADCHVTVDLGNVDSNMWFPSYIQLVGEPSVEICAAMRRDHPTLHEK